MKSNKGFTLVELIVVIAILVLLSTLAVNAFSGIMEQARIAQDRQAAAVVASSLNTFNSIAVNFASTIGPADTPGVGPTTIGTVPAGVIVHGVDSGGFTRNVSIQHNPDGSTGMLPIGVSWNMEQAVWGRIQGVVPNATTSPHIQYFHSPLDDNSPGGVRVRGTWQVVSP